MKKILNQFQKLNEIQEQLITLCDEKMAFLSQKKLSEAHALLKKELLTLHDMECALQEMKVLIAEACKRYGLPEGRLETLFPHVSTEEKNELMACQRCAFRYEKIIKNKLKNSNRQVEMKMFMLICTTELNIQKTNRRYF